jgi:hypothetical protein
MTTPAQPDDEMRLSESEHWASLAFQPLNEDATTQQQINRGNHQLMNDI